MENSRCLKNIYWINEGGGEFYMISNSNAYSYFLCLQKNITILYGMTPISSHLKKNFYWNPWVKRLNLSKGILGGRQRTENWQDWFSWGKKKKSRIFRIRYNMQDVEKPGEELKIQATGLQAKSL